MEYISNRNKLQIQIHQLQACRAPKEHLTGKEEIRAPLSPGDGSNISTHSLTYRFDGVLIAGREVGYITDEGRWGSMMMARANGDTV